MTHSSRFFAHNMANRDWDVREPDTYVHYRWKSRTEELSSPALLHFENLNWLLPTVYTFEMLPHEQDS
jgi:hypothetical protein